MDKVSKWPCSQSKTPFSPHTHLGLFPRPLEILLLLVLFLLCLPFVLFFLHRL